MNLLEILPIILIVFISGCASQVNQPQNEQASNPPPQQLVEETQVQSSAEQGTLEGEVAPPVQQEQSPTLPTVKEYTVEITNSGFTPGTLTIKSGDKVAFVNKDSSPHWPASAVHPTHCEYKGCGVFDAKKGLSQGESYSIVFDLTGNWKYHDHLNSGKTGAVVVQ